VDPEIVAWIIHEGETAIAAPLLERAKQQCDETGEKARLLDETPYAAGS
jgi:hypothetical protein